MSLGRLFIKKTVADIQAEGSSGHLKRTLGPLNLISLGIGAIIGAGIFVITGAAAAQHAGPAIVLAFVLAGIACAFAGLCYAELSSVLPVSGSAYTYAYTTLGEIVAWVMGLLLLLEYGMSAATVAVGWSGYIVSFLADFGIILPPQLTAAPSTLVTLADGTQANGWINLPSVIISFLITCLLIIGIKESANFNNIVVVIKLAVILLFVAFGVWHVDTANWVPFIPPEEGPGKYGFNGVVAAAGMIFFAYIGFEAVSTAAQEAKNPQRDMPIGILGSLVFCTLLYIIVSAVLTGIVSYKDLNVPDPIAVGVNAIGMPWLAFVVKLGAITGLSSVMMVTMYGQTRIFYIMSRDGLLPAIFSKVHPKFQTPHINTMIVGLMIACASGFTPITVLGHLVSMGTLAAFCVVCFSVLYLRYKEPQLERPFRCPGMPFVPVLGIASCAYLIFGMKADPISVAGVEMRPGTMLLIWIGIGLVFYALYSFRNSKLAAR